MSELDGSVFDRPVAAFRVIPYFARTALILPPLQDLVDISQERLAQMKESTDADPDNTEDADDLFSDD